MFEVIGVVFVIIIILFFIKKSLSKSKGKSNNYIVDTASDNMIMDTASDIAFHKYDVPLDFVNQVLSELPISELDKSLARLKNNNEELCKESKSEQYAFVLKSIYDRYLIKIGHKFDYFKKLTSDELEEQRNLGINYLSGENNIPKDIDMAEKLLIRTGLQGDAISQELLGDLYYKGGILPQNFAKATEWYILAANVSNSKKARGKLDWMYSRNEAVNSDEDAVLKDLI